MRKNKRKAVLPPVKTVGGYYETACCLKNGNRHNEIRRNVRIKVKKTGRFLALRK
jgi:hypothetical protein